MLSFLGQDVEVLPDENGRKHNRRESEADGSALGVRNGRHPPPPEPCPGIPQDSDQRSDRLDGATAGSRP